MAGCGGGHHPATTIATMTNYWRPAPNRFVSGKHILNAVGWICRLSLWAGAPRTRLGGWRVQMWHCLSSLVFVVMDCQVLAWNDTCWHGMIPASMEWYLLAWNDTCWHGTSLAKSLQLLPGQKYCICFRMWRKVKAMSQSNKTIKNNCKK